MTMCISEVQGCSVMGIVGSVHTYMCVCVCVCVNAHDLGTDWVCTERQCLPLTKVITDLLLPLSRSARPSEGRF